MALLEDYFHIRGLWYQGPKKALRWLEKFDGPTHRAFSFALEPGANSEAIRLLAHAVIGEEISNRAIQETAAGKPSAAVHVES
jgi:hypothetical protein